MIINQTVLAYIKSRRAIQSCKTIEQLTSAEEYVKLYLQEYESIIPEYYKAELNILLKNQNSIIRNQHAKTKKASSKKSKSR